MIDVTLPAATARRLPDLPSQLIRVSLRDLRKVEKDEGYRVNMGDWHCGDEGLQPCEVCMAGAVMAKTLKVERSQNASPYSFDSSVAGKLLAIDFLRNGDVASAIDTLSVNHRQRHTRRRKMKDRGMRGVVDYHVDPARFRREMLRLARDLEAVGL